MMNLIPTAIAADTGAAANPQTSMLTSFAPLVLIMVVFYFLLIRPQQKKMRIHQNMLNNIAKSDKVITSGGILGTVVKVEESTNYIVVEIAENVKVKIKRDSISEVINEQTPSKAV